MQLTVHHIGTNAATIINASTTTQLYEEVESNFGAPKQYQRYRLQGTPITIPSGDHTLSSLGLSDFSTVECWFDLNGGDALNLSSFLTLFGGLLLVAIGLAFFYCLAIWGFILYYCIRCVKKRDDRPTWGRLEKQEEMNEENL